MSKLIAVYGSLKSGHYNHYLLGEARFLGETTVRGTLYSMGAYPALAESGDKEYHAEVYEVPDEEYERIRRMELGAGYIEKEKVWKGSTVTVFYVGENLEAYIHEAKMKEIETY
jgi:gamma-glutamylcyclotransferase (GGCT)/AIG2-like uncharacterized protein YtfP